MGLFLESVAKPLLVVHALVAAALLGSCTHAAYELVRYLLSRPRRPKLERIHARLMLFLYSAQFTLGAVLYPTYRVKVRHNYFDAHLPWATNLFDIKEMFAAFGLGLVIVYYLLSRVYDPHDSEHRKMLGLYAFCGLSVTAIVWFSAISGLLLTTFRAL